MLFFSGVCDEKISIHALTRSATGIDSIRPMMIWYFNPRTHEECDAQQVVSNASLVLKAQAMREDRMDANAVMPKMLEG